MQPDLFTPPTTPEWCWVCEQHRVRPLGCGADCMEQDYPERNR